MSVYRVIAAITGELAKSGIAKAHRNTTQGFDYRGIDDVYNALAPLIAKHGLVIVPKVLDRTATERTTAKGGTLFHNVLTMTFDFISAEDGSSVTVGPVLGEAMDSGDKAINKAMSVAYKYAAFQVFCIPLEAQDPDADSHQVEAPPAPEHYEQWKLDMRAVADSGGAALKEAWTKSALDLRKYVVTHDKFWWDAVKAHAERIAA